MKNYVYYSDKLLGPVEKGLGAVLVVLMAAMVIDVSWQVLTRFAFSDPSSYTEELARFFLIWIGILGAAYAFRKGAHLGLDLLTERLKPPVRHRTAKVANACCLIFALAVMVYGGIQLVSLTLELKQTSSALGVRMGYIYTVIPISGVLIALFALDNLLRPDRDEVAAAKLL